MADDGVWICLWYKCSYMTSWWSRWQWLCTKPPIAQWPSRAPFFLLISLSILDSAVLGISRDDLWPWDCALLGSSRVHGWCSLSTKRYDYMKASNSLSVNRRKDQPLYQCYSPWFLPYMLWNKIHVWPFSNLLVKRQGFLTLYWYQSRLRGPLSLTDLTRFHLKLWISSDFAQCWISLSISQYSKLAIPWILIPQIPWYFMLPMQSWLNSNTLALSAHY